jgi:hypothetical protein
MDFFLYTPQIISLCVILSQKKEKTLYHDVSKHNPGFGYQSQSTKTELGMHNHAGQEHTSLQQSRIELYNIICYDGSSRT